MNKKLYPKAHRGRPLKNKGFAFWSNDLFPYLCGGTITKRLDGEVIETEEFGPGYYFKPWYEVGIEEGKKINKQLEELKEEYYRINRKINEYFILRAELITSELTKHKHFNK